MLASSLLLLRARAAAHPHTLLIAMSALHVRSEPWVGSPSKSDRAVFIELLRPAQDSMPGSGGRPVPATQVVHCGVVVIRIDESGFHTDRPTVRPRAVLTGTVFVNPRFRRQGVLRRRLTRGRAETAATRLHGIAHTSHIRRLLWCLRDA